MFPGLGEPASPARVRAPSFDLTGQAFSGYLSLQGDPAPAPPMRAGTALNDTVTGLAAAAAAMMGYISSERTGTGQSIDVAQYQIFFTLLENMALDYFLRGVVRGRHGRAHPRLYPYDVYPCRDGWVVPQPRPRKPGRRSGSSSGSANRGSEAADWPARHRTEVDAAIVRYFEARTTVELARGSAGMQTSRSPGSTIWQTSLAIRTTGPDRCSSSGRTRSRPVQGAGIAPKFGRTRASYGGAPPGWDRTTGRSFTTSWDTPSRKIGSLESSGILGSCAPSGSMPPEVPFYRREGR